MNRRTIVAGGWTLGLSLLLAVLPAAAEEAILLREKFPAGYHYHVSTRVQLSGTLAPPPEMGKGTPKAISITGDSAIEYDERILEADEQVKKTVRGYRRYELQRRIGDKPQQSTLRQDVRRLVLMRLQTSEVPFSPDGPLTWGEIDLVRTDVFTPALNGLLGDKAVRSGDRWPAAPAAVQELTDLDEISEGQVECRLEQITTVTAGRPHARVGFSGTVRGVNEDGPNRQHLEGYLFFDLESKHLSYLYLKGISSLLDSSGKELGRVEGHFVLTRRPTATARDLEDSAFRGLSLTPNDDNTRLLYDNAELGVRFLHPRRWRVQGVRGAQVALDGKDGSGLLLTVEPLKSVPTADQFLTETRTYLQQQKARLLAVDPARTVQAAPRQLDRFGLEVEAGGQRAYMDYFVARQERGGATLAARLLMNDLAVLRREVEDIARSLKITK
jgi:hypothetical protein